MLHSQTHHHTTAHFIIVIWNYSFKKSSSKRTVGCLWRHCWSQKLS